MIDKSLETSILLGIYEASILLMKKNIEFVNKAGLTNQQWVILLHLAKDPNLPYLIREEHTKPLMASELSKSLGVSRANITNRLSALIEKKFIKQIEDSEDRRKKRLILTAKGEKLMNGMQKERQESNKNMLKGFSVKQKKEFLKFVQKATENIQASFLSNS